MCQSSRLPDLSVSTLNRFVSRAVDDLLPTAPLPLPVSLAGCRVELCASRQLLLTSSEAGACSQGLFGHQAPVQPAPPALNLQPELFVGKAGGPPCFWECHSGGSAGFPFHRPAAGQYGPAAAGRVSGASLGTLITGDPTIRQPSCSRKLPYQTHSSDSSLFSIPEQLCALCSPKCSTRRKECVSPLFAGLW